MSKKYSLDEVNKLCILKNGSCISEKYINCKATLNFKCNIHNFIWTTSFDSILHGSWCPKCGNIKRMKSFTGKNKKLDLAYFKNVAIERDGECLSDIYVNANSKLKWKCNKDGYEWEATPGSINTGRWCKRCVHKEKLMIDNIRETIRQKGGICLSKKYYNHQSKLKIQCNKCHNIWYARYYNIHSGCWCPICSSGKTERLCREYIENKTRLKFPKIKPDWLQGLELDGFCKDLNLAFEYNGEQHYKKHRRFHKNKQDFLDQIKRDRLKRKLCKNQGIKLITIPHIFNCYKPEKMYKFIDTKLNL